MIYLDPSSNDIHHSDRGKGRCTGLPEQLLQQQQQHQHQKPQQQNQRTKLKRQHKFYGDIVNAIMLGGATPLFVTRMYADRSSSGLDNFDAVVMVGAVALSGIFQGLAWKYDSLVLSRLGFLGNCFAGSFMELKEWPLKGVCTITQRFEIGVISLCLANISLSIREQLVRLTTIFVVGSYVSLKSPYSVYTEDTLPHLGGAVLAAILALYVFHNSVSISNHFDWSPFKGSPIGYFKIMIQKDESFVQLARLILVAMCSHQMYMIGRDVLVYNASAERILEGLAVLTKVSIIVSIGSVATGVFKTNKDQKEQLEIMVRERTKEIRLKNTELRRINIAFEACETAIAITDASRTVTWSNQAFEALSKKTRNTRRFRLGESSDTPMDVDPNTIGSATSDATTVVSSINQQLTDVIVLDGNANETKLKGAFDFSSPRQDEIEIRGDGKEKHSIKTQYRVEVTPFTDQDDLYNSFDDDIEQEAAGVLEASSASAPTAKRKASFRDIRIHPSKKTKTESFTPNINKLFLVAFHDITADHAREQAEQNAQEEALLSNAMKESMVTLTHELRTPLQGIMGITSLMLEQKEFGRDAKQLTRPSVVKDNAESLGLIMASSTLLLNLINNLLDVKKATANMMDEFLLAPMLASKPIRDAIDFCKPLASISNVNITMGSCGDTAEAFVNANPLRLQQVLINMLSNAIKYTDQGTTISVSTRPSTVGETMVTSRKAIACCSDRADQASFMTPESAPVLVFSVSDSGPGIEMDQAQRLFHRFARLNQQPTRTLGSNTVGQPSGTGLGLHLCQMFVQRMRGWIWVENNADRGSTFSFCLPLVGSPETPLHSPSFVSQSVGTGLQASLSSKRKRGSVQHQSPSIDYRKLRVLVVDDILINRKVLDRMLKKIGVVQVSTVDSGQSALDELFSSGKTYDLVITDLQMPGMSGIELTEAIVQKKKEKSEQKQEPPDGSPPLVVVGLTADMSPGVAEKCALSGMSDLLYKPITIVEIKEYFQTKVSKLQAGEWCSSAS